jgi:hypothetical protein
MSSPSITEARRPESREDPRAPFETPSGSGRRPDANQNESEQQFFVEWEVPQRS